MKDLFFGPGFKDFDKFFVGFDAHFDHLNELAEAVSRNSTSYPPYNIVRVAENDYHIELAVAGFDQSEINIELENGILTVKGEAADTDYRTGNYLHQGIANRNFTRKFGLNEEVEVRGADLKNGLLRIGLERVIPEHKKPKKITIGDLPPPLQVTPKKELLTEKEDK